MKRPLFIIRRSALFEIVLFLGAALAIDFFFFDGSRFWSTPQHPFWFLILLVTVQYGTNAGLVAATLSTAALLVGNLPPQAVTQDRYAWLLEIVRLPLCWFLAAVILGELRMRQIGERDKLRADLAAAEQREQTLAEAYKRLAGVKDALETRVAGQLRTAVSMYEAAKAVEKLEPSEVLLGVSGLIRSVMNPRKFSLYLLQDDALKLAVEEGWTADDPLPRSYAPQSPIFREVIGRQRVLCAANPENERVLSGEGMIAAPLIAANTGYVLGMLKIEKLGFMDLNFSNVQTFKVLCEWIGTAYGNARRYQAATSESVLNSETELFSYSFLGRQTSILAVLARRIEFDLTMILVRLENPDDLTEEQCSLVPPALTRTVSTVLRKSDLAFDYQRTGTEFAIMLPATSAGNAQLVAHKLRVSLESELAFGAPQARFSLAIHAIHETNKVEDPRLERQIV